MSLFKRIFHYFNWNEEQNRQMLIKAIHDAVADDVLTPEEYKELSELRQILRISQAEFETLLEAEKPVRLNNQTLTIRQWLQTLPPVWQQIFAKHGLSPYLSDMELKYAYKKLELINIKSDTHIDDLNPLIEFPHLTGVDVDIVKPISLEPITHLPNLTFFSLSYLRSGFTSIKNIDMLETAQKLTKLVLKYLIIHDLNPIGNLKKLKYLEVVYQGTKKALDISPLYPLNELETLILEGTPIMHLKPLINLKKLKKLNIQHCKIKSLEGIENCHSLTHLYAGNNPITDIHYLSSLPYLEHLELSNTNVRDISPIVKIKDLKSLEIVNTPIQNLDVLEQVSQLTLLKVDSRVNIKWLNMLKQKLPICEIHIL
ncbi:MAG: leucine-rich repeat domain-containing protein [Bacteroidia bacterium]|nr:leucine-rich repeat domain-containing protein [Bacteroidia bacterium]MDW8346218.1 leucine-rich repeat domain-containing protein [Bacteroidia bacterium]